MVVVAICPYVFVVAFIAIGVMSAAGQLPISQNIANVVLAVPILAELGCSSAVSRDARAGVGNADAVSLAVATAAVRVAGVPAYTVYLLSLGTLSSAVGGITTDMIGVTLLLLAGAIPSWDLLAVGGKSLAHDEGLLEAKSDDMLFNLAPFPVAGMVAACVFASRMRERRARLAKMGNRRKTDRNAARKSGKKSKRPTKKGGRR
jgi:hypothetical protein